MSLIYLFNVQYFITNLFFLVTAEHTNILLVLISNSLPLLASPTIPTWESTITEAYTMGKHLIDV